MLLSGGAISWQSQKQKSTALSSTDAEYVSLSNAARQIQWVQSLMEEIGYPEPTMSLYGDNQGSVFIASNPVMEVRSKHIKIKIHHI